MVWVLPTIITPDAGFSSAVDLSDLSGTDHNTSIGTGLTVVVRIRPVRNLRSGNQLRVYLRGANSQSTTVTAAYIGEAATSGHAWDFASSPASTQLTFNSTGSVVIPEKRVAVSDVVDFEFNAARVHLVAFTVTAGYLRHLTAVPGSKEVVSYYKSNTSEAGTADKSSGYTAFGDTAFSLLRITTAQIED